MSAESEPPNAGVGNNERRKVALPPSKVAALLEHKTSGAADYCGGKNAGCRICLFEPQILDEDIPIPGSDQSAMMYHNVEATRRSNTDVFHGDNKARKFLREAAREENINERTYQQLQIVDRYKRMSWLKRVIGFISNGFKIPMCPSEKALQRLAEYCFPPRCDVKALVYDIGDEHATFSLVDIGNIERAWRNDAKPSFSKIRWIHVPMGYGPMPSAIEDLFRYSGPQGKPFKNAGIPGFPYAQIDTLQFCSKHFFDRIRATYNIIAQYCSSNPHFYRKLNGLTFRNDKNEWLFEDVMWRCRKTMKSPDFCALSRPDIPLKLNENPYGNPHLTAYGSFASRQGPDSDDSAQALSLNPYFANVQLIGSRFRTWHSSDGFLLTMSAGNGFDFHYRNNSSTEQRIPHESLSLNPSLSRISRVMHQFLSTGMSTWHRKTVEWLVVYLLTEVGSSTDYPVRGESIPNLRHAYASVVADLKLRSYENLDPQDKNKTIQLVKDYIQCVDELKLLAMTYSNKIAVFEGLMKDCQEFEQEYEEAGILPDNIKGTTAIDRAKFASSLAQRTLQFWKAHIEDLTTSQQALFQLRSIDQDQRSLEAQKLGKAVFALTSVTIVFLPLSFFTSYFGMNLPSIVHTQHSEKFFWGVCGSVSFVIILFALLNALSSPVLRYKQRRRPRGQQEHLV